MPPKQLRSPTRRADAERNRDKILAAARAAFADPEAEVSMAEIAWDEARRLLEEADATEKAVPSPGFSRLWAEAEREARLAAGGCDG